MFEALFPAHKRLQWLLIRTAWVTRVSTLLLGGWGCRTGEWTWWTRIQQVVFLFNMKYWNIGMVNFTATYIGNRDMAITLPSLVIKTYVQTWVLRIVSIVKSRVGRGNSPNFQHIRTRQGDRMSSVGRSGNPNLADSKPGPVGSNPGRVKLMTLKIDTCHFLAWCSALLEIG